MIFWIIFSKKNNREAVKEETTERIRCRKVLPTTGGHTVEIGNA
jgi:hypothetical protein